MSASKDAAYWIGRLGLEPHPEGGYFRRTYRSTTVVSIDAGERVVLSAILYLLTGEQVSRLHRLGSDEAWHFHAGDPLELVTIDASGAVQGIMLGPALDDGQQFQLVIPAGHWFGARVTDPGGWTLVGCTVAPGFEFSDFELAERASLTARFPQHAALIEEFTRD